MTALVLLIACSTPAPTALSDVEQAELAKRRKARALERLRELEPSVCEDPDAPTCKKVQGLLLEADLSE